MNFAAITQLVETGYQAGGAGSSPACGPNSEPLIDLCDSCGDWFGISDLIWHDGYLLCRNCLKHFAAGGVDGHATRRNLRVADRNPLETAMPNHGRFMVCAELESWRKGRANSRYQSRPGCDSIYEEVNHSRCVRSDFTGQPQRTISICPVPVLADVSHVPTVDDTEARCSTKARPASLAKGRIAAGQFNFATGGVETHQELSLRPCTEPVRRAPESDPGSASRPGCDFNLQAINSATCGEIEHCDPIRLHSATVIEGHECGMRSCKTLAENHPRIECSDLSRGFIWGAINRYFCSKPGRVATGLSGSNPAALTTMPGSTRMNSEVAGKSERRLTNGRKPTSNGEPVQLFLSADCKQGKGQVVLFNCDLAALTNLQPMAERSALSHPVKPITPGIIPGRDGGIEAEQREAMNLRAHLALRKMSAAIHFPVTEGRSSLRRSAGRLTWRQVREPKAAGAAMHVLRLTSIVRRSDLSRGTNFPPVKHTESKFVIRRVTVLLNRVSLEAARN